jgi:CBS-domain-containing membrane protein
MFVVSSGLRAHALRSILAGACVGAMAALAASGGVALALVPFTATLVLLVTMPGSPAARLRAVIGSHLICSIAGLIALKLLGAGPSALAVAVGGAVFLMLSLDMLHPPASIGTFVVMTQAADWTFLLAPLAVGLTLIALMVLISRLYAMAPMGRGRSRAQAQPAVRPSR